MPDKALTINPKCKRTSKPTPTPVRKIKGMGLQEYLEYHRVLFLDYCEIRREAGGNAELLSDVDFQYIDSIREK